MKPFISITDGNLISDVDYFSINTTTGVVYNHQIIDTDSQEVMSHGAIYTLIVVVSRLLLSSTQEIKT